MFWSCLPTVVCTAISNGEFYKRWSCGSEQRGTETSWRDNHLQSRLWSHHISKRDSEFGISRLSFLLAQKLWRMVSRLAEHWWWLERMRQTTWMRKSTTTLVPRDMRLKKLQLVIDEQSPMRIKPDSLIFLVKRKMRDHYVLLNRRQMPREWRTTRHMFHSEIGVQSVASRGRSSPHRRVLVNKKRRIHCRNSRQTTCSFEQWQRVKLSHVSHSRKRAVEWWSASCAPRKVVMRLDERNPETFDGFLNPVIIRCD